MCAICFMDQGGSKMNRVPFAWKLYMENVNKQSWTSTVQFCLFFVAWNARIGQALSLEKSLLSMV